MRNNFIILIIVFLNNIPYIFSQSNFHVSNMKCENQIDPLSVTSKKPAFSWKIIADARNFNQYYYHILVSDNQQSIDKNEGNFWDSKKIKSSQSIMNVYNGKSLQPEVKYYWKVMIWDKVGRASAWSETATFQIGLLNQCDWGNATWIGFDDMPLSMRLVPGDDSGGDNLGNRALQRPVIPLLRKEFEIKKKISSATLFITGLGQYEAYINGIKIGNSFLSPGWSNYDKTILYNTFIVTSNLKSGKNVIGTIIGNGFYNINRERYHKLVIAYGFPKLICKLKIIFTDGTSEEIVSDKSWKTSSSPILYTSIFGGEDYDPRLEQKGWNNTGFDDSNWKNAVTTSIPTGKLSAEQDYPVIIKDTISVKKVYKLSQDKYLYDFGQNASGVIGLKVKGKRGQVICMTPSELIKGDKEVNQNASGEPYYYTYILKGDEEEIWCPRFTYYGFRYIQIEGSVPDTTPSFSNLAHIIDVKLLHTCNSAPSNGTFRCSNYLFNRIDTLIEWAISSNMQSILTDCPHREKLGWLEQTFLMGESINYNYDIYELYKRTVYNIMDDQTTEGLVPDIAPEYVKFAGGFRDSPEWGSASIIIPWLLYKWYGDTELIGNAWPMMVKYVEYLSKKSQNHILSYGLGDWYDLGPKPPGESQLTLKEVTATLIYYYDVKLLSKMAGIINKKANESGFSRMAKEILIAFNNKFFNPKSCLYSTGSQTAMSMPLCFGIVDSKYHKKVLANLIQSIITNKKVITAGDIGFHFLVEALTNNDASQLLYEMNNRDDVSGYGFQLKKGATSLTESWDASEDASNNHLMLGHLMQWFYNGVGGINQSENSTAFKNLVIKPGIVGNINCAITSYNSPYGTILTDWKKEETKFSIRLNIPANTSAEVYIPVKKNQTISENNIPVNQLRDIKFIKNVNGYSVYFIGSGNYSFIVE